MPVQDETGAEASATADATTRIGRWSASRSPPGSRAGSTWARTGARAWTGGGGGGGAGRDRRVGGRIGECDPQAGRIDLVAAGRVDRREASPAEELGAGQMPLVQLAVGEPLRSEQ